MAAQKPTTSEKPNTEVAAAPVAQQFQLSLDEFCQRKSLSDRRVELLGAFHSVEAAAGRVKDTEAAFDARFVEFANKPA